MNKHLGTSLDSFLQEDGTQEEVTAAAVKRVIAWQISEAMKKQKINKTEMALRMRTSRMAISRLLDATDTSVTLATLARASVVLNAPLKFKLETTPA